MKAPISTRKRTVCENANVDKEADDRELVRAGGEPARRSMLRAKCVKGSC